nr:helix-turn-helix domain-containing protein [Mycoplana dimorpha]
MSGSLASSLNAERALEILLVLGEVGPEGIGLAEIAQRTGSAKSAAIAALRHCCRRALPSRPRATGITGWGRPFPCWPSGRSGWSRRSS